MNIIVRFYWQHDLDLIALVKHPDFDMAKTIKAALKAYASQEPFSIELPPRPKQPLKLENCYVHFTLTHGRDDLELKAIENFRVGFRNSALKMLVRSYLKYPCMAPLYYSDDYIIHRTNRHANKKKDGKVVPLPNFVSAKPVNTKETAETGNNEIKTIPKPEDVHKAVRVAEVEKTIIKPVIKTGQTESPASDINARTPDENPQKAPAQEPADQSDAVSFDDAFDWIDQAIGKD